MSSSGPPPGQIQTGKSFPPPISQQPVRVQTFERWQESEVYNYLRGVNAFVVKQEIEMIEVLTGWNTANRYSVMDQSGNRVFYVGEEANFCCRQCAAASQPFTLHFKDNLGGESFKVERSCDCNCCCGLLCADRIYVSTSDGRPLGSVVQTFDLCVPAFDVRDAANNRVLYIRGPFWPISFGPCLGNVNFNLYNWTNARVGIIAKRWSGLLREGFTNADNFAITFPAHLEPAIKATCLAALFFIDYRHFNGCDRHQCCDSCC